MVVCGRFGVEKLLCREIAAWERESWHRRVLAWGSFGVGELQCSVGELWGGGIVVGCIAG